MKKKLGRPKMSLMQHLGLSDEPSYKDAKDMLVEVYEHKGQDAAVKILQQFKAEKLSSLKPRHFARFIKLCRQALDPQ